MYGGAAILLVGGKQPVSAMGLSGHRHDQYARGETGPRGGNPVCDRDCWHPDHDAVEVDDVIRVLMGNADHARALVKAVAPRMAERPAICPSGNDQALEMALITSPDCRDPEVMAKLDAVAGRVLKA